MIRDAEAARKLTFLVPPQRYGKKVAADLRARVLAELGNAYRVAGDFDMAGDTLAGAATWARRGTGDPRLLARIGDLAASLHIDNRRFDEAIAMLLSSEPRNGVAEPRKPANSRLPPRRTSSVRLNSRNRAPDSRLPINSEPRLGYLSRLHRGWTRLPRRDSVLFLIYSRLRPADSRPLKGGEPRIERGGPRIARGERSPSRFSRLPPADSRLLQVFVG